MPTSDRAFRALATAEPEVIAELLRAVRVGLLPRGVTLSVPDLGPTRLDALAAPTDVDWVTQAGKDRVLHLECQGYRDLAFLERLFWYHLGLALRHRPSRVETVALWLLDPPPSQETSRITVETITVEVTTIILPRVPAEALLEPPTTACFAAGADAGGLSDRALCERVAEALVRGSASWYQRHMAVVAAAMVGRYDAMVTAMSDAGIEPVIIEDLVRFGEDRGLEKGLERGLEKGLVAVCERKLGRPLMEGERGLFRARLRDLSVEAVSGALVSLDATALVSWLRAPSA